MFLEVHFTFYYIYFFFKQMKIYSTSLVIREVQLKTTMCYHLHIIRMTKIKTDHTSVGDDIKELELSHTASMNVKMVQHFGKV